ncbi:MAG: hypothetical protein P1V35_17775 [Planctomycetota bacterium]|nr:hypothetical protein [Planctomycetota bacterium]
MPQDPNVAKTRFIWRRGVLGVGLGAGLPWLIAMWISDRMLPWPWMVGILIAFPLVGYLWAARMWKQGRG